ncbi:MAG: MFS transporter [Candidatus Hydrothermarchaeales archaeon]
MSNINEGYRWRILVLVFISMLSFGLVFQSIPPVLALIIDELGITHAQAGLLMGLFALPGIFLAILSGMLSDYYGARRIGSISLALIVIGTAISGTADGFTALAIGRLVAGIGALTYAVVAPQILSQWFMGKEVGLAMGFFNTGLPLGTIIAFNAFGRIGIEMGWRAPILLTTAVSMATLLLFLIIYKPVPVTEKKAKAAIFTNPLKTGPGIWLVGGAWMWFNAGFIAFLTFAPDYFVSRGLGIARAGFLASIIMFAALILNPVIGYLSHRFGIKEVFIAVGGVLVAVLFLLIPFSGLPILALMVLLGVAATLTPPSIYSLPSDILPPEKLGLGFGIITTLLNVGIVLGPYLVGLTIDVTGEFTMGFVLMAAFTFLAAPTILVLKMTNR